MVCFCFGTDAKVEEQYRYLYTVRYLKTSNRSHKQTSGTTLGSRALLFKQPLLAMAMHLDRCVIKCLLVPLFSVGVGIIA